MAKYGLIGKNIGYSFSKSFFTQKFENEDLSCAYENFDIPNLDQFPRIISENPSLKGLNVTIPYKEKIIPFLDDLDEIARNIGAVNVIKILDNKKLIGYNTDHFGFTTALSKYLPLQKKTALILGTGGASKAVAFSLKKLVDEVLALVAIGRCFRHDEAVAGSGVGRQWFSTRLRRACVRSG